MNYEVISQKGSKALVRFTFPDGLIYEREVNIALRDDLSQDNELTEKYMNDLMSTMQYKRQVGVITPWEVGYDAGDN